MTLLTVIAGNQRKRPHDTNNSASGINPRRFEGFVSETFKLIPASMLEAKDEGDKSSLELCAATWWPALGSWQGLTSGRAKTREFRASSGRN